MGDDLRSIIPRGQNNEMRLKIISYNAARIATIVYSFLIGFLQSPVNVMLIYASTICIQMMSVVSVRVDKRVKERLERSGVKVSEEVKKHLEDLAWQLELCSFDLLELAFDELHFVGA